MKPAPSVFFGPSILDRMVQAVEAVRDRLRRATAALDQAGVLYGIVGGNAVAAWVASVDRAAVRNTQDVDILLRRSDMDAATAAMAAAGFVRQEVFGVEMFLDGPMGNPRDAVHVLFAGEKVTQADAGPAPDVGEAEPRFNEPYRIVGLEALLRMKLIAYRRKDQVHIQDLIGVGLIDASWLDRVPAELAPRLKELLDDPNG